MTLKYKLILGIVVLIVISAIIETIWSVQSDNLQNIWSFFSDTNLPEANTDASMLISFLTLLSMYILRKIFLLLRWFKKKKRLRKNFKSVVKHAPNKVGVYIVRLEGKVVYIGRAIEDRCDQSTSGLRKRLQEHYRGGHTGNSLLFTNRDKINIEIKVTGSVEKAKKLEARLIRKFNTVNDGWNQRYED